MGAGRADLVRLLFLHLIMELAVHSPEGKMDVRCGSKNKQGHIHMCRAQEDGPIAVRFPVVCPLPMPAW